MGRGKRRATIVIAATPSAEAATRGTRPRERRTATAAASSVVPRGRTVRPGKSPQGPETTSWATSHRHRSCGGDPITALCRRSSGVFLRLSSGRSRNLRAIGLPDFLTPAGRSPKCLGPIPIRHRDRCQSRRIDQDMSDAQTLPRVRHMHVTVCALNDGRIRVFARLAFENQRGVPRFAIT